MHNNRPIHKTKIMEELLDSMHFHVDEHYTYSPHLNPSLIINFRVNVPINIFVILPYLQ